MADFVQRDRNHPSVTIWSFCVSDPAPAPAGGGDAGAAAHTVVSFYRCCLTLRTRAERTRMWSEPDRPGPAGRPWYEQLEWSQHFSKKTCENQALLLAQDRTIGKKTQQSFPIMGTQRFAQSRRNTTARVQRSAICAQTIGEDSLRTSRTSRASHIPVRQASASKIFSKQKILYCMSYP